MSTAPLKNIYQLKITLTGSKPPIWRRILVPSDIALGELHLVLQVSMGWTDSHLHQFVSDGVFYGIEEDDSEFDMEVENEDKYKLNQLLKSEKDTLNYEYDFGDGWEHKVLLEDISPFDKSKQLPSCIKGKRACPPEDCGGIWGYQELLDTVSNPNHPEHENRWAWLECVMGGEFDSEALDITEINETLVATCQLNALGQPKTPSH